MPHSKWGLALCPPHWERVVLTVSTEKQKKNFFFPFSLASTIFKWFHFTILPWVVPNKRFKSQTNCSEAEFAFAKGLSVQSLGWGVAMPQCHTFTEQLHSCLEADYSLGWLKINWIYFSHLGSHP